MNIPPPISDSGVCEKNTIPSRHDLTAGPPPPQPQCCQRLSVGRSVSTDGMFFTLGFRPQGCTPPNIKVGVATGCRSSHSLDGMVLFRKNRTPFHCHWCMEATAVPTKTRARTKTNVTTATTSAKMAATPATAHYHGGTRFEPTGHDPPQPASSRYLLSICLLFAYYLLILFAI